MRVEKKKAASKQVEEEEAQANGKVARSGPGLGGRGKKGRKPGSTRDAAKRAGSTRQKQARAEEHVAIADRYRMLQAPDW